MSKAFALLVVILFGSVSLAHADELMRRGDGSSFIQRAERPASPVAKIQDGLAVSPETAARAVAHPGVPIIVKDEVTDRRWIGLTAVEVVRAPALAVVYEDGQVRRAYPAPRKETERNPFFLFAIGSLLCVICAAATRRDTTFPFVVAIAAAIAAAFAAIAIGIIAPAAAAAAAVLTIAIAADAADAAAADEDSRILRTALTVGVVLMMLASMASGFYFV